MYAFGTLNYSMQPETRKGAISPDLLTLVRNNNQDPSNYLPVRATMIFRFEKPSLSMAFRYSWALLEAFIELTPYGGSP